MVNFSPDFKPKTNSTKSILVYTLSKLKITPSYNKLIPSEIMYGLLQLCNALQTTPGYQIQKEGKLTTKYLQNNLVKGKRADYTSRSIKKVAFQEVVIKGWDISAGNQHEKEKIFKVSIFFF